ncbi:hypothetical protein Tco_1403698 [Tanacetum coccineum]
MDLPKAMTDHSKTNDDLEFEMVSNHPEDKDSVKFNDSCELVDTAIKDATNNKLQLLTSAGTEGLIPPKTAEQKLARKNELKAKSTLLLAIPYENLLKFHGIKDAKTLWEAIKARHSKSYWVPLPKDILGASSQRHTGYLFPKTYWVPLPKDILG